MRRCLKGCDEGAEDKVRGRDELGDFEEVGKADKFRRERLWKFAFCCDCCTGLHYLVVPKWE
jgi:hypothetical protein